MRNKTEAETSGDPRVIKEFKTRAAAACGHLAASVPRDVIFPPVLMRRRLAQNLPETRNSGHANGAETVFPGNYETLNIRFEFRVCVSGNAIELLGGHASSVSIWIIMELFTWLASLAFVF